MNIPVAMCALVVCAAGLRTCSSHERGLRDFINEKFSRCEDGDISVVGFAGDRLPDWLVDVAPACWRACGRDGRCAAPG